MELKEYRKLPPKEQEKVNDMYQHYLKREIGKKTGILKFKPFKFDEYIENEVLNCPVCGEWEDAQLMYQFHDGTLICESCRNDM